MELHTTDSELDLPYAYASTVRPPTFKELVEDNKKLEDVNFQLRMRIHLHERRTGKINTKEIENLIKEYSKQDTLKANDLQIEVNELRTQLTQAREAIEEKTNVISTLESHIQDKNGAMAQVTAEYGQKVQHLTDKLDETSEDLLTKSNLVSSLEILIKEKNEMTIKLDLENSKLKDKIIQMTAALKGMGYRVKDEEKEHSALKIQYQELETKYDRVNNDFQQLKREYDGLVARSSHRPFEDPSPDLGIELGLHDGLDNLTPDQQTIKKLKIINKELSNKLKTTKVALGKTIERLNQTELDKEQVEKAVCRQLHRTHGILRAARKNLENPAEPIAPLTEIN